MVTLPDSARLGLDQHRGAGESYWDLKGISVYPHLAVQVKVIVLLIG